LTAVGLLELCLDLRLLALPGDLGDRAHPEGVVGDAIADGELRQLVDGGRLAAGAEAGTLHIAPAAADPPAEGRAAARAAVAEAAAVAATPIAAAAVSAAEAGTAERGAGARHVQHLFRHLVEEAA